MSVKGESRSSLQFIGTLSLLLLLLGPLSLTMEMASADNSGTRAPGDGNYDDPEITVTLDEDVFYTKAVAHPDGNAEVTGSILCVIPSYVPSTVWVKLTVSLVGVDLNYDGTKEMYASKEEPLVDFLMTVYSGYQARAGDTYDFEVQVIWTYSTQNGGSGVADPAYGMIEISPYGFVFMDTIYQSPIMDITIGESFNIKFDVFNHGNSYRTVKISVENPPLDTEISLSPSEIEIVPFGQEVVDGIIIQGSGDEQEVPLVFRIQSYVTGRPTVDEFTFTMRSHKENEKMEFDLTIALASGFIIVFFVIMVIFMAYIYRKNKSNKSRDIGGGENHYQ